MFEYTRLYRLLPKIDSDLTKKLSIVNKYRMPKKIKNILINKVENFDTIGYTRFYENESIIIDIIYGVEFDDTDDYDNNIVAFHYLDNNGKFNFVISYESLLNNSGIDILLNKLMYLSKCLLYHIGYYEAGINQNKGIPYVKDITTIGEISYVIAMTNIYIMNIERGLSNDKLDNLIKQFYEFPFGKIYFESEKDILARMEEIMNEY